MNVNVVMRLESLNIVIVAASAQAAIVRSNLWAVKSWSNQ